MSGGMFSFCGEKNIEGKLSWQRLSSFVLFLSLCLHEPSQVTWVEEEGDGLILYISLDIQISPLLHPS